MTQLQINFDTQRARSSDPVTSHYAAIRAKHFIGKQAQTVLTALEAFNGLTSAELAKMANLDRYMVARRLPDLEKCGRAKKGKIVKCSATGSQAVTWWIAEGGDVEQLEVRTLVRTENGGPGADRALPSETN